MERSHVLAKVLTVVGVYAVCVVFGATPLVSEPYVFDNEVVCNDSFGRLFVEGETTSAELCGRSDGTDCP